MWLKKLLKELNFTQETITLHEDNQACIALSKNSHDHKRMKHVYVKYNILRVYVKNKELQLVYCPTKSQLANMFTKALAGHVIRPQLLKLGIITIL